MVMRITRDYQRPVLEITENGCAYNDRPGENGSVNDVRRIEFHRQYLAELHARFVMAPTFAGIMPGA